MNFRVRTTSSAFSAKQTTKPIAAFDNVLSLLLDDETREYWRRWSPLGGRRINMFANNFYRYSLMGRFIGILHVITRLNGKRLEDLLEAKTRAEQRAAFDLIIAPMLENKAIQLASKSPLSLYALGISPAQYSELIAESAENPIAILRARVEKLACDFPVSDNYFAWRAFARGYDVENREAVPPYLRRDVYEVIRKRTDRVEVHHASLVDLLEIQPAQSLHRYVLLDAQDWMTPVTLNRLWTQIDRTAASADARVIFRTAGTDSLLPRKLSPDLLAPGSTARKRAFDCTNRIALRSTVASTSMRAGRFHEHAPRRAHGLDGSGLCKATLCL